jgi:hypothetical protein
MVELFIHASGSVIRQPALACSCQLGPGTPTFASFLAASFLPFVVYNDPTFNPARYDVNRDLRTVVDVMEHTYDFSADTTSLAQYLRSGRKGYRVAGDRRHADVAHRYDSVL